MRVKASSNSNLKQVSTPRTSEPTPRSNPTAKPVKAMNAPKALGHFGASSFTPASSSSRSSRMLALNTSPRPDFVVRPRQAPAVGFGSGANSSAVSGHSHQILQDIMQQSGVASIKITSTSRGPEDQARAMYDNLQRKGVESQLRLYGDGGDQVIRAYQAAKAKGWDRQKILDAMEAKIRELGPANVSSHAADLSRLNVVDIAPSSIPSNQRADFVAALKGYVKATPGAKFIGPPDDPAFHLEIPQPLQGQYTYDSSVGPRNGFPARFDQVFNPPVPGSSFGLGRFGTPVSWFDSFVNPSVASPGNRFGFGVAGTPGNFSQFSGPRSYPSLGIGTIGGSGLTSFGINGPVVGLGMNLDSNGIGTIGSSGFGWGSLRSSSLFGDLGIRPIGSRAIDSFNIHGGIGRGSTYGRIGGWELGYSSYANTGLGGIGGSALTNFGLTGPTTSGSTSSGGGFNVSMPATGNSAGTIGAGTSFGLSGFGSFGGGSSTGGGSISGE
jgi:hypothetical protein